MKPAPFEYVRARSPIEAVQLLANIGDGARVIAGGQSLLPALNLRLDTPTHLIDISGIAELRGISVKPDGIRIGAGTRHSDVERSELIAQRIPLLAEAVRHIAHPAIRNRGTIGGNLAYADPASELPACMVALDAVFVVLGQKGERRIPAARFYTGMFATALEPGEILTAIEIPSRPANEKSHFSELSRRRGDYAIIGLACVAQARDNAFKDIRPVYLGAGDGPVLASKARSLILSGDTSRIEAGMRDALAEDLTPQDDLQASAVTRLHLAAVLLKRCIAGLTGDRRAA
ncbi:MAG: xanthine dehydrogenase family protein subunit M [Rhodomicrobium sp.]